MVNYLPLHALKRKRITKQLPDLHTCPFTISSSSFKHVVHMSCSRKKKTNTRVFSQLHHCRMEARARYSPTALVIHHSSIGTTTTPRHTRASSPLATSWIPCVSCRCWLGYVDAAVASVPFVIAGNLPSCSTREAQAP